MIIAVDFDGTIVRHAYPDIGREVPGAIDALLSLKERGAKLMLWTMRSNDSYDGDTLNQAVDFCKSRGLSFWGLNENPEQDWSSSNKQYAHVYVDDSALGCPVTDPGNGSRPYVDWTRASGWLHQMLDRYNERHNT